MEAFKIGQSKVATSKNEIQLRNAKNLNFKSQSRWNNVLKTPVGFGGR